MRFKRTVQVADEAVNEPFLAYALAVARSVAAAMQTASTPAAVDPLAERSKILEDKALKWISLNALLRRCWEDLGIAVIQLLDSPESGKGFDAATFRFKDRYVVVLAKVVAHPARAAFFLAHELGHIARGDLQDGQAILDDEHDFDDSKADNEETKANAYALALLGGRTSSVVAVGAANSRSLRDTAFALGESLRIDPGHIVLRFGHESQNWEVASAALKQLTTRESAADSVNGAALRTLDLSTISDDLGELVINALTRP